MDELHEFIIGGSKYRGSARMVTERLANVQPSRIHKYSVVVGAHRYPIKQAVSVGLGVPSAAFQSQEAFRVLRSLGFEPVEEGQNT